MDCKIFFVYIMCISFLIAGCATPKPAATPTLEPTPIPPTDTPIPPTDTPLTPSSTPTETATEKPPEFPTGKFFNSSFQYKLIIEDDGTWEVHTCTRMYGLYKVEGVQVTLTDESGWCNRLGEGGSDGIYTWTFTDGVLQLHTIEDVCQKRSNWVTAPYKQQ